PLARASTFLGRAPAATARFTLGMASPSGVRQHAPDQPDVGLVHHGGAAQAALALGALLREDVAQVRMAALESAARTALEPLGRAAVGLQFGHGLLRILAPRLPARRYRLFVGTDDHHH